MMNRFPVRNMQRILLKIKLKSAYHCFYYTIYKDALSKQYQIYSIHIPGQCGFVLDYFYKKYSVTYLYTSLSFQNSFSDFSRLCHGKVEKIFSCKLTSRLTDLRVTRKNLLEVCGVGWLTVTNVWNIEMVCDIY